MRCTPQIIMHHERRQPKISVILIDWGVRESFHSLQYLNRQTVARDDYELIWLEFYDRKPPALQSMAASGADSHVIDKWYVLGYPDDCIFHKHRLYNAGLLAATGDICVICDSDAIFRPTFIENLLRAFEETTRTVVHLDEVRNNDSRFYPFNFPRIEEVLGPGCINWQGDTTTGLYTCEDLIHGANYGACMAARRRDLLAIGGADEHLDYLGYVCGPYEMTFRLANHHGRVERWLRNEYLYHVWHPNTSGINDDYHGPHDGKFMSLLALDARASFRVKPLLGNPLVGSNCNGSYTGIERFFEYLKTRKEPEWKVGAQPAPATDIVYWAERNYRGFNLFVHDGNWHAVDEKVKKFDPDKARRGGYGTHMQAGSREELQARIDALPPPRERFLEGFRRKLFAQPLRCLPMRAWRKSRRVLGSFLSINGT